MVKAATWVWGGLTLMMKGLIHLSCPLCSMAIGGIVHHVAVLYWHWLTILFHCLGLRTLWKCGIHQPSRSGAGWLSMSKDKIKQKQMNIIGPISRKCYRIFSFGSRNPAGSSQGTPRLPLLWIIGGVCMLLAVYCAYAAFVGTRRLGKACLCMCVCWCVSVSPSSSDS